MSNDRFAVLLLFSYWYCQVAMGQKASVKVTKGENDHIVRIAFDRNVCSSSCEVYVFGDHYEFASPNKESVSVGEQFATSLVLAESTREGDDNKVGCNQIDVVSIASNIITIRSKSIYTEPDLDRFRNFAEMFFVYYK